MRSGSGAPASGSCGVVPPERVQYQAPAPRARAPAAMPPIGSAQASRSNPCVAGVESTPGPKFATISSRICCFVQPWAMRLRNSAFICCATAEFDWSRVSWQVGQTSSVSRSLSLGCASDARTGAANTRASATPSTPAAASSLTRAARG